MSRYFSLNAWGPRLDYGGDVNLIVVNFDWSPYHVKIPYASATVGLFGLCACLTLWPKGKIPSLSDPDEIADAIERPAYFADFGPNVPVEDLGGTPVGMEKAP